jgi:hypothetical protein
MSNSIPAGVIVVQELDGPDRGSADDSRQSLRAQHVPPPGTLYVGLDDTLFLSARSLITGAVVTITGRWRDRSGEMLPFQRTVTPANTGAESVLPFQLGEGYLYSVTAQVTGVTARRGDVFVQLRLVRAPGASPVPIAVLLSDYVTSGACLGYPFPWLRGASDGQSSPTQITQAAPAAGADVSITVPANTVWRVIALQTQFTTSAAVANRFAAIGYTDAAGNPVMRSPAGAAIPASQAPRISAFIGAALAAVAGASQWALPLPAAPLLLPGYKVVTQTFNIDAADQWNITHVLVEQYLDA